MAPEAIVGLPLLLAHPAATAITNATPPPIARPVAARILPAVIRMSKLLTTTRYAKRSSLLSPRLAAVQDWHRRGRLASDVPHESLENQRAANLLPRRGVGRAGVLFEIEPGGHRRRHAGL